MTTCIHVWEMVSDDMTSKDGRDKYNYRTRYKCVKCEDVKREHSQMIVEKEGEYYRDPLG